MGGQWRLALPRHQSAYQQTSSQKRVDKRDYTAQHLGNNGKSAALKYGRTSVNSVARVLNTLLMGEQIGCCSSVMSRPKREKSTHVEATPKCGEAPALTAAACAKLIERIGTRAQYVSTADMTRKKLWNGINFPRYEDRDPAFPTPGPQLDDRTVFPESGSI